jgi:hypothetical protein
MLRKVLIVVVCLCVLLAASEMTRTLVVGWIGFLGAALPKATVSWPAVISGLTIFALFTGMLDGFARWCCRAASRRPGAAPRRWRFRWTLSIVCGVLLMFAVGYSAIGLARHVGWVLSSPEPLEGPWLSGSSYTPYPHYNLDYVGKGFLIYLGEKKQLPPGGTFDRQGNMLHSWETELLPYIYIQPADGDRGIDMTVPWNHPSNAKYFKSIVAEFINLDFRTQELFDAEGYGLSHYAANSRVLRANRAVRPEKCPGGASNTILIGEVNHDFKPWGYPANWRDPTTGINQPGGFGGAPNTHACRFVMMDGSVRTISEDVDPHVLEALSGAPEKVGTTLTSRSR